MLEFVFCGKFQKINLNHYYKIYSKFVDRFLLQIRGLFCGQTLTTFCGQILATDSWTFLWTDSCYFSVDRLADLVDRICGQILVINSGQILWTNLCTFVWQIFVTDSIDKNTNLDIEILLTEFVDKFVQPWQTFFDALAEKNIKDFLFSKGEKFVFCGTNFSSFLTNLLKRIS